MTIRTGDLRDRGLDDIVRSIYLERGSGVLEVAESEGKKRFHFLDGELHLPPGNPLSARIARLLDDRGGTEALEEVLRRIATLFRSLSNGSFRFEPDESDVSEDLVGPLPTAELLMLAATHDQDENALYNRLGGARGKIVGRYDPDVLERTASISNDDLHLLTRLDSARSVDSVLAEVEESREETLLKLCRLAAVGLVGLQKQSSQDSELLSEAVLARFSERVAGSLESEPSLRPKADHRERIASLLAELGDLGHYELLDVEPSASIDAVHAAYEKTARLVHPSQAENLGLAGKDEGMRLLFERATEAYLVLTDPARRSAYDRERAVEGPAAEALRSEKSREAARIYYRQARNLLEEEDYYYAVELLSQAVTADPKVEYYLLLAEALSKNPKWLHRVVDAYRAALERDPGNLEVRLGLAETFERIGEKRRALGVYRSVLIRDPNQKVAAEAVQRLRPRTMGIQPQVEGFWQRLLRGDLFRRG